MKKLEVKDLKENFFEAIGKEWMLVTAGTKEKFNTMTASWGGIGWLWNKPVAFVFAVRLLRRKICNRDLQFSFA